MSKSEKRYFKLFAGRHTIGEQNYYLALFEAVDRQSEYDEESIVKQFKGSKMAKNLSSVKVQLTNLILRSLRQYKGNKKKKYDVRSLLDYADILFEKGLYSHCTKILQKAKKIANEYDLLVALDEISVLEHEIALKTYQIDELQKRIDEEHPQLRETHRLNNMLAEFEFLSARMRAVSVGSKYYSELKKTELPVIMEHELLRGNADDLPYLAQIEYHDLWSLYHIHSRDFEKCLYHRRKALELLEQKQQKILDSPKVWIYHARRLLILLGTWHKYDVFDKELEHINKFIEQIPEEKKTTNLRTEIYTTIYITKLDIDIDRGLFEQGAKFAEEVEKDNKELLYIISTDGQIVLYYNLFYVYFGNGQLQKALYWINRIINDSFGKVRIDLQCATRLVNIVLHYELGNYDMVAGLIRSTDRYITKRDRKFEFERAFLRFANKYMQEPYVNEYKDVWKRHIEAFADILSKKDETRVLEFFDYISWMRTRVESRSLSDIMQEKATTSPK